jgi:hypothetical protein
MTNGRAVLGVILAAAALACVARLHHVLSHPSSPPQLTEAPQKAGSSGQQQLAAQEFADWPRSIHTVSGVPTAGAAARRARAGTTNAGTAPAS